MIVTKAIASAGASEADSGTVAPVSFAPAQPVDERGGREQCGTDREEAGHAENVSARPRAT